MEVLMGFIAMFAFLIIFIVIMLLIKPPFFTVPEQRAVIIERMGKFHRVVGPGLHFILPFGLERKRQFRDGESLTDYVDQHERTLRVSTEDVITKDKIQLHVECIAYYQITDPTKAVYGVMDVIAAINVLITTILRDVIEEIESSDLLRGRDAMSSKLREQVTKVCSDWGITFRSVELETVTTLGLVDPERPLQQGKVQHIPAYFLSWAWENTSAADHVEALLWRNNRTVLRDESREKPNEDVSKIRTDRIGTGSV